MKNAAAFQATYSDWRLIKGRKVVQIVFELPLEAANEAYAALGGMPNPAAESWFAIARLNPENAKEVVPNNSEIRTRHDTSPASGPDKVQARARNPVNPDKRLAQRAALLCKETLFWRFLRKQGRFISNENDAVEAVREICAVQSRSEIKPNTQPGLLFDHLYSRFVAYRDADIYLEASA